MQRMLQDVSLSVSQSFPSYENHSEISAKLMDYANVRHVRVGMVPHAHIENTVYDYHPIFPSASETPLPSR